MGLYCPLLHCNLDFSPSNLQLLPCFQHLPSLCFKLFSADLKAISECFQFSISLVKQYGSLIEFAALQAQ